MDKGIVIPIKHNAPRDTQGLSFKKLLKTDDKQLWQESLCCKIGWLAQGWKESCGLNAMFLTKRSKTLKHKKITCGRLVCDFWPAKKETHKRFRARLTVGGNLIEYEGDISVATAEISTIKILWNCALSTPEAKYFAIDTKDMCLADNKEMDEFEYFQTRISYFPQELIEAHDLLEFVNDNGIICWEVRKGMCRLL